MHPFHHPKRRRPYAVIPIQVRHAQPQIACFCCHPPRNGRCNISSVANVCLAFGKSRYHWNASREDVSAHLKTPYSHYD